YGIHLRFKRIYPRMLVGCFAGGLTIAILGTASGGVTTNAFVFTSLLTIPVFSPMLTYTIAVAVAFAVAFLLIYFTDYRTAEEKEVSRERAAAAVSSQLTPTLRTQPQLLPKPLTWSHQSMAWPSSSKTLMTRSLPAEPSATASASFQSTAISKAQSPAPSRRSPRQATPSASRLMMG